MRYNVHQSDLPDDYLNRYSNDFRTISLDLETTGLEPRDNEIQVCALYVPGYPVDIIQVGSDELPINLVTLLDDTRQEFLIHYAPFDLSFLWDQFESLPKQVVCTKTASKLLNPHGKHGLADLVELYYGVKIDKTRRETPEWSNLTDADCAYICRDVIFLPGIWENQRNELKETEQLPFALDVFQHIPIEVRLQAMGYEDIFAYA